jgi:hypothetical protein
MGKFYSWGFKKRTSPYKVVVTLGRNRLKLHCHFTAADRMAEYRHMIDVSVFL